ncbi:MAG: VWA domain-containing protein, partial [Butyricicoccus sp.]
MRKRLTAMLLVVCMLFTFAPVGAVQDIDGDSPVERVVDIAPDELYQAVQNANEDMGILEEDGSFPMQTMFGGIDGVSFFNDAASGQTLQLKKVELLDEDGELIYSMDAAEAVASYYDAEEETPVWLTVREEAPVVEEPTEEEVTDEEGEPEIPEEPDGDDEDAAPAVTVTYRTQQVSTIRATYVDAASWNAYVFGEDDSADEPATLAADKGSIELEVGDTQKIPNASQNEGCGNIGRDHKNHVKEETWSSSDETVASVSNGTVTGKSTGTATITHKYYVCVWDMYHYASHTLYTETWTVTVKEAPHYEGGADGGAESGGSVVADKTIVGSTNDHLDVTKGDEFTIELSVQGDAYSKTGSSADVILVVDDSGSMGWSAENTSDQPDRDPTKNRYVVAKDAANLFVTGLLDGKSDIRMGYVSFAGDVRQSQDLTSTPSTIKDKIDLLSGDANNGTNYQVGLEKAYEFLRNRTDEEIKTRKAYVIFITDGVPNKGNTDSVIGKLEAMGVTVHCVGIGMSDSDKEQHVKPLAVNNGIVKSLQIPIGDQLKDILNQFAMAIQEAAGRDAVMVDKIDASKFTMSAEDMAALNAMDGVTCELVNGEYVITWNVGTIAAEQTLEIPVTANAVGDNIPTNTSVTLNYKDYNGDSQEMDEDDIGEPTVSVKQSSVT